MTEYMLEKVLIKHLKELGIPTDFKLRLRGYSSCYKGRYNTVEKEILLYHLEEDGSLIELDELYDTIRHEALHHYQWVYDDTFTRVKGVMHNEEFKRLEQAFKWKANQLKRKTRMVS